MAGVTWAPPPACELCSSSSTSQATEPFPLLRCSSTSPPGPSVVTSCSQMARMRSRVPSSLTTDHAFRLRQRGSSGRLGEDVLQVPRFRRAARELARDRVGVGVDGLRQPPPLLGAGREPFPLGLRLLGRLRSVTSVASLRLRVASSAAAAHEWDLPPSRPLRFLLRSSPLTFRCASASACVHLSMRRLSSLASSTAVATVSRAVCSASSASPSSSIAAFLLSSLSWRSVTTLAAWHESPPVDPAWDASSASTQLRRAGGAATMRTHAPKTIASGHACMASTGRTGARRLAPGSTRRLPQPHPLNWRRQPKQGPSAWPTRRGRRAVCVAGQWRIIRAQHRRT